MIGFTAGAIRAFQSYRGDRLHFCNKKLQGKRLWVQDDHLHQLISRHVSGENSLSVNTLFSIGASHSVGGRVRLDKTGPSGQGFMQIGATKTRLLHVTNSESLHHPLRWMVVPEALEDKQLTYKAFAGQLSPKKRSLQQLEVVEKILRKENSLYRSLGVLGCVSEECEALRVEIRGGCGTISSLERWNKPPNMGITVCVSPDALKKAVREKKKAGFSMKKVNGVAVSSSSCSDLYDGSSPMKRRKTTATQKKSAEGSPMKDVNDVAVSSRSSCSKPGSSPMKKRAYTTTRGKSAETLLRSGARVPPEERGVFVTGQIGLWDVIKYPLLHPSGAAPVVGEEGAPVTMLEYFRYVLSTEKVLDKFYTLGAQYTTCWHC